MDRFKFRAYITVSYEDDDDNEKEVSFYLYNIIINEDDFIYIDRDFLLDALDNYDDETQDKIEEVLQDNSATGDYENICIERGFYKNLEQCTGLKDKNGKLIYEGDVLKSRYSDVMRYEVVYRNAGLCLRVFATDKPETMDYLHIGEDVESIGLYEIIGNIHENPELLEATND